MMKRRDVLRGMLATGSVGVLEGCSRSSVHGALVAPRAERLEPSIEPALRALADGALEAARALGATYADVRIADYRTQALRAREARVVSISDDTSMGFGVRVIADGAWGFAASSRLELAEVQRVARRAVLLARESARLRERPVLLAPITPHVAVWSTPVRRDAFSVSLEEKADRLLSLNALALGQAGIRFVDSQMTFVREHKYFASTEGARIEQTLSRLHPTFTVTSIDGATGNFTTRSSFTDPRALGYEYIEDYPWEEDVRRAAEDAREKQRAPSVEPGKRDIILHPTNLWLTIHESIGHGTELDRALGYEADFAGTSFLTPDRLGNFQLGSPLINVVAEKTAPGSLATSGYDDDGAECDEWPLVVDGRFVDYQFTRDQAHWLRKARGHACSYADSWKSARFSACPTSTWCPARTRSAWTSSSAAPRTRS